MGLSTIQTYSLREYAFALRVSQCPWSLPFTSGQEPPVVSILLRTDARTHARTHARRHDVPNSKASTVKQHTNTRLIAECELLSTGGKEQDRTYRSQFPRGLKQPTCSPSRLRVRRIRLAMPLPIEGGSRRDWEMPSRRKFCARLTYFVAAISLCSFASANECTPEQAADCDSQRASCTPTGTGPSERTCLCLSGTFGDG
eukprot:3851417-Rhodomonas_salina.1